jgi:ribosomal-protein-alanine N-acetyltransferase
VIETPRLTLRPLTLEDADAAFMMRLVNDPAWLRHIGDRNVRSLEDARRYIQKTLDMYDRLGFGSWVATLKSTGEAVGTCGLVKRDGIDDVEIGYALLPEFRRRGLALESARAVLAYAWDVLRLPRVAAIVTPANGESIKLLERIGLRFSQRITKPGGDEELALYVAAAPAR